MSPIPLHKNQIQYIVPRLLVISSMSGLGCIDFNLLILPSTTGESLPSLQRTGYLDVHVKLYLNSDLQVSGHVLTLSECWYC